MKGTKVHNPRAILSLLKLILFLVHEITSYPNYMWMGQVKMEHYFHTQQNVLLQIPHVLTIVNLHSNFVLNTCNISEDAFAFEVFLQKNSNYIIVLLEHVLKFCF